MAPLAWLEERAALPFFDSADTSEVLLTAATSSPALPELVLEKEGIALLRRAGH